MYLHFLWPAFASSCLALVCLVFLGKRQGAGYAISLLALLSFFCTSLYICADHFTGRGIDESVYFHVFHFQSAHILLKFWYLPVAVVGALLFSFVALKALWGMCPAELVCGHRYERYIKLVVSSAGVFFAAFSFLAHPTISDILALVSKHATTPDENLLDFHPQKLLSVEGGAKKNIIYIYAESLEATFMDEKRFPNLTPRLNKLISEEGLIFSGISQMPLTGWTIAGMVASQCGIPLSPFKVNRDDYSEVSDFLPGVDCVGDVLSADGYSLTYFGGADLEFAGKGVFYKSHGFDSVNGLNELLAEDESIDSLSKWGVYDDKLFSNVRRNISNISDASQAPFGVFMLTLDTHSPSGFPSPSCEGVKYGSGNSGLLNAVACADAQLSDFLEYVFELPLFENTVVVLASDHLAMANDAGLYALDDSRENLFVVFEKDGRVGGVRKHATPFDIAPTILDLLGYNVGGYGLGRSLYGDELTLLEKMGRSTFEEQLVGWRSSFWKFWRKKKSSDKSL